MGMMLSVAKPTAFVPWFFWRANYLGFGGNRVGVGIRVIPYQPSCGTCSEILAHPLGVLKNFVKFQRNFYFSALASVTSLISFPFPIILYQGYAYFTVGWAYDGNKCVRTKTTRFTLLLLLLLRLLAKYHWGS
jgi:hypothetical protein